MHEPSDKGTHVIGKSLRCVAALSIAAALVGCAPLTQVEHAASANASIPAPDARPAIAADCHPLPDAGQPQYIIGYGSLMQDESRKRTSPQAGSAHPIELSGYRRGWFARGDPVGFSTTYLGVLPDAQSHLNAVIYRVETSELATTDRREASYCRWNVPFLSITALEKPPSEVLSGQAWIYVNSAQDIATPSARFPIVQSYVDIFVSGCLEQEQRFGLEGFAQQCLATTHDWSEHWVNDRLYPRRPFIHQPKSRAIDLLLSQQLPALFSQIKIEGGLRAAPP
jgi:hypothetical protein